MMVSLDGFVAGPNGGIVGAVDEEVHRFANREAAKVGTKGVDRHLDLEMIEEHRFGSGVVFLRYRPR